MGIICKELALSHLKSIKLSIAVIVRWVDDISLNPILKICAWVTHGHTNWIVRHLWKESCSIPHDLFLVFLEAISTELFMIVCRVGINVDFNLKVLNLLWKITISILLVSPLLNSIPFLWSTFNLACSWVRHTSGIETFELKSKCFLYLQILFDVKFVMVLLQVVESLWIQSHDNLVNISESKRLLSEVCKVNWNQDGCQKYEKE